MIVSSLGITYRNSLSFDEPHNHAPRPGVLEIGRGKQCVIAEGSSERATVFLSRPFVGNTGLSQTPTLLVFKS